MSFCSSGARAGKGGLVGYEEKISLMDIPSKIQSLSNSSMFGELVPLIQLVTVGLDTSKRRAISACVYCDVLI